MMDRSFLFVPGNRPERFDKAYGAGAHAVIVDLEDAVAPADKAGARESARAWLSAAKPVWLRINGPESEWFAADLDLVGLPGIRGVMLPKAEDAAAIGEIRARAGSGVRIIALIESALGLWRAEALASAPGVERLAFGSVDFQLDTGIAGDREELLFARSHLVLASRVAGRLAPVDGVTVAIDDEALLREDVERARRLGFGGKLCIHPKQVAGVNAGFVPPEAELAWARRVLAAAEAGGNNAVRLDGKLIDLPIIDRARALLAQAAA
ncbi:MAG TPA: CoA ester lyase [Usitatibacteraceae bacterium]|nr:CoA ester lyase [Usitatibacteraceae bacterium]